MGFLDHSVALGPFNYNAHKASHTRTRYVGVPLVSELLPDSRTPPVSSHLQVLQGVSGETSSSYFQELGATGAPSPSWEWHCAALEPGKQQLHCTLRPALAGVMAQEHTASRLFSVLQCLTRVPHGTAHATICLCLMEVCVRALFTLYNATLQSGQEASRCGRAPDAGGESPRPSCGLLVD